MKVRSIESLMNKPYQSEISSLSSEIKKIRGNIININNNIDRGYILHVQTETKPDTFIGMCVDQWMNPYYCPLPTTKTERTETPVPINFKEEKSRLKFFESKLLKLKKELQIFEKKRNKEVIKLEPQYKIEKKKAAIAFQKCKDL